MFILRLIVIKLNFFFQKSETDPHPPHITIREGRVLVLLVLSGQKVGKNGLILLKSRM